MTGRLHVRVPPELERVVRSIPKYPDWLRRVIADAVSREFGDGLDEKTPTSLTGGSQKNFT